MNKTMVDGSSVTEDHRDLKPNGQQKGYVVLSEDERAKGFIRSVRRQYIHGECGGETTMSQPIAETYAREPGFYSDTFCAKCGEHFPVDQFTWSSTDKKVGS